MHEVKVIVQPHLLNRLKTEDDELLVNIERRYEGRLTFRSDPALHHEKFTILDALTNQPKNVNARQRAARWRR